MDIPVLRHKHTMQTFTPILIVDDKSTNLDVLEHVLDDPNYRLVRASSADEALNALLGKEEFALLILDVRMPGMSGLELAQMIKMRKRTAQVPIIFLTAYGQEQELIEGYGSGAVDYLGKPVNALVLRAKVAVFAELHHRRLEAELTNRVLLAEASERLIAAEHLRQVNDTLGQRTLELARSEALEKLARHAAELSQQQAEAAKLRLHSSIDVLTDGFVLYDVDDRLVLCNAPYRQMFTAVAELLIPGTPFEDILRAGLQRGLYAVPPGQEEAWSAERLRRHRSNCTFNQQHADGTWLRISEQSTPDGGVVGFRVDITQQQQLQKDLEQALVKANAAILAKTHFLANMSHEIRTPMNAILGMTYLAQIAQPDTKTGNYLNKISQASKQLLGIIDDILDASKIEAGKLVIEEIPFSLETVFEALAGMLRFKTEEKGLALMLDIAPSLPPVLLGDPLRLGQILLNLGGNAVKFTEQGQITICVRELAATAKANSADGVVLEFSINDSGIGMTPEQCANLFQPFSQADSSITRKYGGTGLGLSIAQSLAHLMGGTISVKSYLGVGSTFIFNARFGCLAAPTQRLLGTDDHAVAASERHRNASAKTAIEQPSLNGKRVLLVEDNDLNQGLVVELLRMVGVTVTTADNGQQALDVLRRGHDFDVILMDGHMPVMDGYQATVEIRQNPAWARLPIIALTADAMSGSKELVLAAGMSDYLSKPLDVAKLYEALSHWTAAKPLAPGPIPAATLTNSVPSKILPDALPG